jgi:hypothetical protein
MRDLRWFFYFLSGACIEIYFFSLPNLFGIKGFVVVVIMLLTKTSMFFLQHSETDC